MKLFRRALFPLYFPRRCKAYIRRQSGPVLSRSVLSFPFRSVLSFTSPIPLSFSLSFSFRSELHRGSLIAVAYRKGRFCTRVTGNTPLTPSIKVSGGCDRYVVFHGAPLCQGSFLGCRSRSTSTAINGHDYAGDGPRSARVFIKGSSCRGEVNKL